MLLKRCLGTLLLIGAMLSLFGCAIYEDYDEAMVRANQALEQAELANHRIDVILDKVHGGK